MYVMFVVRIKFQLLNIKTLHISKAVQLFDLKLLHHPLSLLVMQTKSPGCVVSEAKPTYPLEMTMYTLPLCCCRESPRRPPSLVSTWLQSDWEILNTSYPEN